MNLQSDCKGDSFFTRRRRSVSSREGVYDPNSLAFAGGHIVSQGPIHVTDAGSDASQHEAQTSEELG